MPALANCLALISAATVLSLLLSTSAATPTPFREGPRHRPIAPVRRQTAIENVTSTYAVTGLTQYGVQPRLEIRQLEQRTDQWNLFLLGLQRMMQANESAFLSHYNIAGIHGRPYVEWGNVQPVPGSEYGPGYCMHTSPNFLPWHRPYTTLYEQVVHMYMVQVVNQFQDVRLRNRYALASIEWRLPYWDWAADPPEGESILPASLGSQTVNVTTPSGPAVIDNPLYAYVFHPDPPVEAFYFQPWNQWLSTIRGPSELTADAYSEDNVVASTLDNERGSLKDRLYALLTNYQNYTQFSNQADENHDAQHSDSMERLHNVIHNDVGSGGTMTYLEFSAHDPIFFLHHAFVDRCFALWQTLYPDSYVEPMAAVERSFTIEPGWIQDVNSPLYPFSSDSAASWYTASNIVDWTTLGYTYPEFVGDYNASTIRAAVNQLYGNVNSTDSLRKRSDESESGTAREYFINIVSDKMAVNGSYAIYVFMGDFDASDPACWPTSDNLVGVDGVFSSLRVATDDGDYNPSGPVLVSGSIPLTSTLIRKYTSGEICSMNEDEVEEYLTEHLNWRVASYNGTEIPLDNLPSLQVSVVASDVTPPAMPDEFPVWGDFWELQRVTRGKPGGCL